MKRFNRGVPCKSPNALRWMNFSLPAELESTPTPSEREWLKSFGLPGYGLAATPQKERVTFLQSYNQRTAITLLRSHQRGLALCGSTLLRWDRRLRKWVTNWIMLDVDSPFQPESVKSVLTSLKELGFQGAAYPTPSGNFRIFLFSDLALDGFTAALAARLLRERLQSRHPELRFDRSFPSQAQATQAGAVFLPQKEFWSLYCKELERHELDFRQDPYGLLLPLGLVNSAEDLQTLVNEYQETLGWNRKTFRTHKNSLINLLDQIQLHQYQPFRASLQEALAFWRAHQDHFKSGFRNDLVKGLMALGLKRGLSGTSLLLGYIKAFGIQDEELKKRLFDLIRTLLRAQEGQPVAVDYFLAHINYRDYRSVLAPLLSRTERNFYYLLELLNLVLYRALRHSRVFLGTHEISQMFRISKSQASSLRQQLVQLKFLSLELAHAFQPGSKKANEYSFNWLKLVSEKEVQDSESLISFLYQSCGSILPLMSSTSFSESPIVSPVVSSPPQERFLIGPSSMRG